MKLKTKLILILMCFGLAVCEAQDTFTLTGKVTAKSDNMPIPSANIVIEGTRTGVATDFDGNYQIQVKRGDVLVFSYIGFATQRITIDAQTVLNVVLEDDAAELEEVVVIGYGTQKKSHVTGSISKVVNDDLDQIAVPRVDDALVGQVSGVNIAATEGEAGSDPTIGIRGTGSINADSAPTVVVDGVVVDSDFLTTIDMNDVESFEILKDAASAAIYG